MDKVRRERPVIPASVFWPLVGLVVTAAGLWFTTESPYQATMLGVLVLLAAAATAPLAWVGSVRHVDGVWARDPDRDRAAVKRTVWFSLAAGTVVLVCRYLVAGFGDDSSLGAAVGGSVVGSALFTAGCAWWGLRRRPRGDPDRPAPPSQL